MHNRLRVFITKYRSEPFLVVLVQVIIHIGLATKFVHSLKDFVAGGCTKTREEGKVFRESTAGCCVLVFGKGRALVIHYHREKRKRVNSKNKP